MALKVGELFASFSLDSSGLDGQISSIEKKCSSIASGMAGAGMVLAPVSAAFAKISKDIFKTGADFDAQMSRVSAISGTTGQALDTLKQKALDTAKLSSFTTLDAGKALEYMGMAGWNAEQMMAGLAPIMRLAEASGEELGKTSDIVTDALTAFRLKAEDAAHFADVLAVASTKSNTNVGIMGETFKYVATQAGAYKVSIEETAEAIGLMANSGLKGTMAGTSLSTILSRLATNKGATSKSLGARDILEKELGVKFYDAKGEIRDFRKILDEARIAWDKLTMEEKANYAVKIAGTSAQKGWLALMNASTEDVELLRDAILNCDGAADDMAVTMKDNLAGDITYFKSAVDVLYYTLSEIFEPAFRPIVQTATKLINRFGEMDKATQRAALKFIGLTAAASPVLLIGSRLVKFLPAITKGIASLVTPVGLVTASLALFAVAAVDENNEIGTAFINMSADVRKSLEDFAKTVPAKIKEVSDRMPDLIQSLIVGMINIVPAAVNAGFAVITGFVNMISDNAYMLSRLGGIIVTELCNAIAKNLPTLIPAAVDMVAHLADAVSENLGALASAGTNIVSAMWDGIVAVNWSDFGARAGVVGRRIINAIAIAIKGLSSVASKIVSSIATAISGTDNQELHTGFKRFAKSIIKGFTTAIPSVQEAGETLVRSIAESLNGIQWENAVDTLTEIGTAIVGVIKQGIKSASGLAVTIVEAIGSMFSEEGVATKLVTAAGTIATSLLKSIVDAVPSVAGGAVKIIKSIGAILSGEKTDAFTTAVAGVAESLVTSIVSSIPKVANGAVMIISAIGDLFKGEGAADSLLSGATGIATSLIQAIAGAIRPLMSQASKIVFAIGDAISDYPWGDAIGDLTSLGAAIMSAIEQAILGAGSMAVSVVTAIGKLLSTGIDWNDTTLNLSGFATMIFNGIVVAIRAAGSVGSGVLQAIGDAIGKGSWTATNLDLTAFADSIIKGVVTAISTITTVSADLSQSFVDLFGKIDWSGFGTTAGTIVTHLITGIVDAIPNAIDTAGNVFNAGLSLANGILTAIMSGLETLAGQDVGNTLGNAAASLIDKLLNSITKLGESAEVKKFMANLGEGLRVAMGELGNIAGAIVSYIFSAEGITAIFNAGKAIAGILWSGIEGVLSGVGEFILGIFHIHSGTLTQSAQTLEADLAAIMQGAFGGNVDDYVFQNIGQDAGKAVIDNFIDQIGGENMSGYSEATIAQNLKTFFRKAIDKTIQSGDLTGVDAGLWQGRADALSDDFWTTLAKAIQENHGDIGKIDLFSVLFEEAANSDTTTADDGKTKDILKQNGVELGETAKSAISEGIAEAIDENGNAFAVNGFAAALAEGEKPASDAALKVSDAVVQQFLLTMTEDNGKTIGNTWITSIQTGIGDVDIVTFASNLSESVKAAFEGIISYGNGYSIGWNIAMGISNGITAALDWVVEAARQVAQAAIDAAKETLDIHSPSGKAEREVGMMYDRGLAGGLLKGINFIKSAARNVSDSLHDQFMVGDMSRGTVYTARRAARQTAEETAIATGEHSRLDARAIGRAMAEYMLEHGGGKIDIYLDSEKVGSGVSNPVSIAIAEQANTGRPEFV